MDVENPIEMKAEQHLSSQSPTQPVVQTPDQRWVGQETLLTNLPQRQEGGHQENQRCAHGEKGKMSRQVI